MNIFRPLFSLFFSSRALQVLLVIVLYTFSASFLPPVTHKAFYTFSMVLKDLLIWVMPVTVFFFIAQTLSSFKKSAPVLVLLLFVFEAVSNFSSIWYAFGFFNLSAKALPSAHIMSDLPSLKVLWEIPLKKPHWWSAQNGVCAGVLVGCVAAFFQETFIQKYLFWGKSGAEKILTRFFSPLIPLFVLGFLSQLYVTQLVNVLFSQYAILLFLLVLGCLFYLFLLFYIGAGFHLKKTFLHIKNLLPAGGMALTSGCSLSTMPFTIAGTEKLLHSPGLAKAIIPATTNIQQIGDCIVQSFLCAMLYMQFYGAPPHFSVWMIFSVVFMLARFATSAVLGGAIFLMIPIYESYLSFTPQMTALILAFNVILDPLVTSVNVMANGALCGIFEKIWTRISGHGKNLLHSSID